MSQIHLHNSSGSDLLGAEIVHSDSTPRVTVKSELNVVVGAFAITLWWFGYAITNLGVWYFAHWFRTSHKPEGLFTNVD